MFNYIENEEAKIDISPEASRPRPITGKNDHVGHVRFEMDGSCLDMENGKWKIQHSHLQKATECPPCNSRLDTHVPSLYDVPL